MSDVILSVEQISKQYRLGVVGTGTLSHDLERWYYKIRGKEDPYLKVGEANLRDQIGETEYVWALKDISFTVNRGEVFGIVGRNGAGKSTLLKILSRVTSPTTGLIKSKGRIASLLEVGTGFHPELTGRENIYLNGAILGMTKAEIRQKEEEIIDFSGCARYVDTPVKRYSSGMRVRLAFAVAAHLEPDILVVDEVLAVGDAEFQKKAVGKMQDISRSGGRTVLFVSHNMTAVKSLCTRGMLLENGKIKTIDGIEKVLEDYLKNNKLNTSYANKKSAKEVYFESIEYANNSTNNYYCEDDISFVITIKFNSKLIKNLSLMVRILDDFNRSLCTSESKVSNDKSTYQYTIPKETLVKGNYKLNCVLHQSGVTLIDRVNECCSFVILNNNNDFLHLERYDLGKFYVSQNWIK